MRKEIYSCVNLLIYFIQKSKLKTKLSYSDEIRFRKTAFQTLYNAYKNHWFTNEPKRDRELRIIQTKCGSSFCRILRDISLDSHLNILFLRAALPKDLTIHIDPECVYYYLKSERHHSFIYNPNLGLAEIWKNKPPGRIVKLKAGKRLPKNIDNTYPRSRSGGATTAPDDARGCRQLAPLAGTGGRPELDAGGAGGGTMGGCFPCCFSSSTSDSLHKNNTCKFSDTILKFSRLFQS